MEKIDVCSAIVGAVVNAQIQRDFFGLEIGSATKQQVRRLGEKKDANRDR